MISLTRLLTMKIAVAMAVLGAAGSAAAAPYTKVQCVEADDQAQSLRREGKLTASRAKLEVCVDAACPALLRDDCAQRLDELDRIQPSVVFEARDSAGNDLINVTVTVDGQPLAARLDGTSLKVDPGGHTFVFTPADQASLAPMTKSYVIRESEKARREQIVFSLANATAVPAPAAAIAPPPATSDAATPTPGHGQRIGGIVLGAAGVVGVGLGAIFGAGASSTWSKAQSECGSASCGSANYAQAVSDQKSAQSSATLATVGFIAGGALLAGGVVLFFTAPKGERASTALTLTPAFGSGGGTMTLGGAF